MSSALRCALESAYVSFQLHVNSIKWKVKQLHHLVDVVVGCREELFGSVTEATGISQTDFEEELETFVYDVGLLLRDIERTTSRSSRWWSTRPTERTTVQPKGVSLIVSESDEPFVDGLCAFAASIAAGNCVVLVFLAPEMQQFASILNTHLAHQVDSASARVLGRVDMSTGDLNCGPHLDVLVISDHPSKIVDLNEHHKTRILPLHRGAVVVVVDRECCSPMEAASVITQKIGRRIRTTREPCLILIDEKLLDSFSRVLAASMTAFRVHKTPVDLRQIHGKFAGERRRKDDVAVLATTSLDHSLDCITALQSVTEVAQIAMFSDSLPNLEYVESFSKSSAFVHGDVLDRSEIVPSGRYTGLIYPPEFFACPRLVLKQGGFTSMPSGGSLKEIRARYSKLIKPLEREPPGGRIDFFVQMAWFVRAVKVLMWSSGFAAAYGAFLLARRYFVRL